MKIIGTAMAVGAVAAALASAPTAHAYTAADVQYAACMQSHGYVADYLHVYLGRGAANDIARGTPPSVEAQKIISNYTVTWGDVTAIVNCGVSAWPSGVADSQS